MDSWFSPEEECDFGYFWSSLCIYQFPKLLSWVVSFDAKPFTKTARSWFTIFFYFCWNKAPKPNQSTDHNIFWLFQYFVRNVGMLINIMSTWTHGYANFRTCKIQHGMLFISCHIFNIEILLKNFHLLIYFHWKTKSTLSNRLGICIISPLENILKKQILFFFSLLWLLTWIQYIVGISTS